MFAYLFKVEKILKSSLDSISSPSVKIQIMHYENKLTKNIRPTNILKIYTKYLVNVFKFTKCYLNVHKFTKILVNS